MSKTEKNQEVAAAKAGMDPKTARGYLRDPRLPSERKEDRKWRTRDDPFSGVWEEVREQIAANPGLEAKTLFEALQRKYPGQFADGQIRTLQRRLKRWRATDGPEREVFFTQQHVAGGLGQSDFTHVNDLNITIGAQSFPHMLFVPLEHRTDRMSLAVNNGSDEGEFTARYEALMRHYQMTGQKIRTGRPNENGDVEQRHYRLKRAVGQALMLRDSRDFGSIAEYKEFLRLLLTQLNAGRRERLRNEMQYLRPLPAARLESLKRERVKVDSGSLIYVDRNAYSVHSRLIGERVEARIAAETIEVWYAGNKVEELPRLRGRGKHRVDYRHIIDWLVRKPGAFENYRYREELFPTSRFRMAWDALRKAAPVRANKRYLEILELAAKEGEARVDDILRCVLEQSETGEEKLNAAAITGILNEGAIVPAATSINITEVSLASFDELLGDGSEVAE